tara:strand:- start:64 stop:243 length:180 start_codon:yes stop_codon:yes gene_type:complete
MSHKVKLFNKKILISVTKRQFEEITEIVKTDENYETKTHFIRCAIIKQLREPKSVQVKL